MWTVGPNSLAPRGRAETEALNKVTICMVCNSVVLLKFIALLCLVFGLASCHFSYDTHKNFCRRLASFQVVAGIALLRIESAIPLVISISVRLRSFSKLQIAFRHVS